MIHTLAWWPFERFSHFYFHVAPDLVPPAWGAGGADRPLFAPAVVPSVWAAK